jgi:hypothetical protein
MHPKMCFGLYVYIVIFPFLFIIGHVCAQRGIQLHKRGSSIAIKVEAADLTNLGGYID